MMVANEHFDLKFNTVSCNV